MKIEQSEWKRFHELLKRRARELCPDYPDIETIEDPFGLLWAITSSFEGTELANDDLHRLITELRERLGLSPKEAYDIAKNLKKTKTSV